MNGFLLDHPDPNFDELEQVIKGEIEPRRVHLVEIGMDQEIMEAISRDELGEPWVPWDSWAGERPPREHFRNLVALYHRLGYDCVDVSPAWLHHPAPRWRKTIDTAPLATKERQWVEEGTGLIDTWADFELFPWDKIKADCTSVELAAHYLPDGMKIVASATVFEHIVEKVLGYEGLCYKLSDDPELVEQVFDRWGQKVYDFYASVIEMDEVGAIFHPDDLGFKTSTTISPSALRKLVFPWLQKYARLAHAHGKTFWLHCCGNIYGKGIIDDLIDQVGIDALHSFQDVILPVTEFKEHYGSRVAALGGIDMHSLATLDEPDLRGYIRNVLDKCMPGGRFALGTGNTVANYIPLHNYSIMLDESRAWSG